MGMYVNRNSGGTITGAFANQQSPGQEYLEDGHPDLVAHLDPPPLSVPLWKLRIGLRRAGLGTAVANYAAQLGPDAQDAWEYTDRVSINSPFVIAACAALGISDAQKAALFRAADAIVT